MAMLEQVLQPIVKFFLTIIQGFVFILKLPFVILGKIFFPLGKMLLSTIVHSLSESWHYDYYIRTAASVNDAIVTLDKIEKLEEDLKRYASVGEGFRTSALKRSSDALLAEWRDGREAKLSAADRLKRTQYIEHIQSKKIEWSRIDKIRPLFKERVVKGKRAALLFLDQHHEHISMRRALGMVMQDMIIPQYNNNIQALVTAGAAFLIVSIGLRAIGVLENIMWVYISLGVESFLLFLYSYTIFHTPEGEYRMHVPGGPASHVNGDAQQLPAGVQDSIVLLATAVQSLSKQISNQNQLKSVESELEKALAAIKAARQ